VKPITFKSSAEFREWLRTNHDRSDVLWVRIFKKGSGATSITYAEALDEALCFGWIDGQKKPFDERSWLQKFTPRRKGSGWSKTNRQHVERLMKAGLMESSGHKAVEGAKADGRWQAAYDSPRQAAPPEDFLTALASNSKARLSFKALNKANVYAIVYRLQTAKKPETRVRRMKMIIEMLERGEKFHP
jgi:uncharacterized protein YdeI (YjbR/CyaY-like superfamily)